MYRPDRPRWLDDPMRKVEKAYCEIYHREANRYQGIDAQLIMLLIKNFKES